MKLSILCFLMALTVTGCPAPQIVQAGCMDLDGGAQLVLPSGALFQPNKPSIVESSLCLNGQFNYAQPTYLVGFKECQRDKDHSMVLRCCAAGFTDAGTCIVPKGGCQ